MEIEIIFKHFINWSLSQEHLRYIYSKAIQVPLYWYLATHTILYNLWYVRRFCSSCYNESTYSFDSVVVSGILFRGVIKKLKLKNFNKKRTWIYWVIDKKKKKSITISFYKFSNFELLHDSSLWVFIVNVGSYDHFILLSLSNIFIFMQLLLFICYYFYKNILN